MKLPRLRWTMAALALAVLLAVAASPWLLAGYWEARSSNPVRRGLRRAGELGCFSCHGSLGREGIPDPSGEEKSVPAWSGGVWMMYVENDDEIRDYILHGSGDHHDHGESDGEERGHTQDEGTGDQGPEPIRMPAYQAVLSRTDLEDLVAAFKAASGMVAPPPGTPARRGLEAARRWGCFSCHGVAGSGGLPNPGSLAGFIPGWYGPGFADLVRDRAEFDGWIREGRIPRLEGNLLAAWFLSRQRIGMPRYPGLSAEDLDALWEYARWLEGSGGGLSGGEGPW